MTSATISADLEAWVLSAVPGATAARFKKVPGGASREAWFVDADVRGEDEPRELFLRYDRRMPKPDSPFASLQDEAQIVRALGEQGALVPQVLAIHPTIQAVLQERVPGETWFYLIQDPDEQVEVAQDFIRRLAEIHRIDPTALNADALGSPRSAAEHAREEIGRIRARLARRSSPAPVLDFCVNWLESNVPAYDGPVVLVQGDTGPGNFMYANRKVTAVVDWELAHFGDPMDDIAWLSLRAAQEPFTDFPTRLAEYEEISGHPIDNARIWYYRLLAETRLASAHEGDIDSRAPVSATSLDAGNTLIYGLFHRRLLVEALGHAIGQSEPIVDVERYQAEPDSAYEPVFAATLHALSEIAGLANDRLASRYAKSTARLVKYLSEIDRAACAVDADELDDAEKLLSTRPSSVRDARGDVATAVLAGRIDEAAYVQHLWTSLKRDDYLMRSASGALRSRTWPPLPPATTSPATEGDN